MSLHRFLKMFTKPSRRHEYHNFSMVKRQPAADLEIKLKELKANYLAQAIDFTIIEKVFREHATAKHLLWRDKDSTNHPCISQ